VKPRSSLAAISLALAGGFAVVAGFAACLDLTPIVYEAPAPDAMPSVDASVDVPVTGDSAPPDASGDVGDAAAPEVHVPPTCVGCLNTPDDAAPPGCGSEIALCLANSKCAATYACVVATGCFQQPSFRDIVNCGLPCAEDAGIMSTTDPAVQLIYNIAICASCNCSNICAIGDSGITCGTD
jgi:hypothetical protein